MLNSLIGMRRAYVNTDVNSMLVINLQESYLRACRDYPTTSMGRRRLAT